MSYCANLAPPLRCVLLLDTVGGHMNRLIWLVGLIVIILFIAGYFGLR